MEEVKKNIKTFLKILEIGKSGSVISWDESNFQRAQKWAQYCEEVFKKLRNKPSIATSLSDYISKNQMCTLGQVRNSITDFNDLQNSKEILHNILLCNPHLSSEQFSHVLQMYDVEFSKLDDQKLKRIIQDTYFISNSRGTFHTLSSIKDCLSTKNSTAEDICSNTCAKLLCQKLGDTLGRKRESEYDYDSGKELLSVVAFNEKGMEIIVRLLIHLLEGTLPPDDTKSNVEYTKDCICQWIFDNCKEKNDNYEKIWQCPRTLLFQLSTLDLTFCQRYLDFLHFCGDVLLGINSFGNAIAMKDCMSYKDSYQSIVEQIQSLLQGSKDTAKLCKEQMELWFSSTSLSEHSKESQHSKELRSNFWSNIYSQTFLSFERTAKPSYHMK